MPARQPDALNEGAEQSGMETISLSRPLQGICASSLWRTRSSDHLFLYRCSCSPILVASRVAAYFEKGSYLVLICPCAHSVYFLSLCTSLMFRPPTTNHDVLHSAHIMSFVDGWAAVVMQVCNGGITSLIQARDNVLFVGSGDGKIKGLQGDDVVR